MTIKQKVKSNIEYQTES